MRSRIVGIIALLVIIGFALASLWAGPPSKPEQPTEPSTASSGPALPRVSPSEKPTITDLAVGKGPAAKVGDTLVVNYTGRLPDGTKFDSSLDKGQPFEFPLGDHRVILGWERGLVGMKVGGKRKLVVQPSLGYGAEGSPDGRIPQNATLTFDIELLKIK
jgi:FKBP-type peptidyl-prolyl cis-trans isomerase